MLFLSEPAQHAHQFLKSLIAVHNKAAGRRMISEQSSWASDTKMRT